LLNPTILTLGSSDSSTLTLSARAVGNYVVTVSGTGGGVTHSTSVTVSVLSPQHALHLVINNVNGLKAALVLTLSQANSLDSKLQKAIASLNLRPPDKLTACSQLTAFVNQVNSYVANGVLTLAQANLLLGGPTGVLSIKASIHC
jgi:hypothetical protein